MYGVYSVSYFFRGLFRPKFHSIGRQTFKCWDVLKLRSLHFLSIFETFLIHQNFALAETHEHFFSTFCSFLKHFIHIKPTLWADKLCVSYTPAGATAGVVQSIMFHSSNSVSLFFCVNLTKKNLACNRPGTHILSFKSLISKAIYFMEDLFWNRFSLTF